jgi:hypothetical protein
MAITTKSSIKVKPSCLRMTLCPSFSKDTMSFTGMITYYNYNVLDYANASFLLIFLTIQSVC